jgi:hypothetical protein
MVACRVPKRVSVVCILTEKCCIEKILHAITRPKNGKELKKNVYMVDSIKESPSEEMITPHKRCQDAYACAKIANVAQKLERLSSSLSRPLPPEEIMLTDALVERPKMLMLLELSISLMCSWQFWPVTHFWS